MHMYSASLARGIREGPIKGPVTFGGKQMMESKMTKMLLVLCMTAALPLAEF
jgi:hypothetical protein